MNILRMNEWARDLTRKTRSGSQELKEVNSNWVPPMGQALKWLSEATLKDFKWKIKLWLPKSQTWLSDFTFTFHFPALEKEMATHSSVLAWRIPGKGEPRGLPSMGSHRVGHNWSDLAAAAAAGGWYIRIKPGPLPSLTSGKESAADPWWIPSLEYVPLLPGSGSAHTAILVGSGCDILTDMTSSEKPNWCTPLLPMRRLVFGVKVGNEGPVWKETLTSSICSHAWLVTLSQALSLVAVQLNKEHFPTMGSSEPVGCFTITLTPLRHPYQAGVSPCTAPMCVPNRYQWVDIMQGTEDVGTWTRQSLALGYDMKNCLSLQLFMTGSFSSLRFQPCQLYATCLYPLRKATARENDKPHAQIPVAFMPREWFSLMIHSLPTVKVQ